MRQVTLSIVSAFIAGNSLTISNSHTDGKKLFLFGNLIAERREDGLWITNAGWKTVTTKERLNALPGVSIMVKSGKWFLNGHAWDGTWVKISGTETKPVTADDHLKAAYEIAEKEVERLAREEMIRNPKLYEFLICMGTYFFIDKKDQILHDYKAPALDNYIAEHDHALGLTGMGKRFVCDGSTITNW